MTCSGPLLQAIYELILHQVNGGIWTRNLLDVTLLPKQLDQGGTLPLKRLERQMVGRNFFKDEYDLYLWIGWKDRWSDFKNDMIYILTTLKFSTWNIFGTFCRHELSTWVTFNIKDRWSDVKKAWIKNGNLFYRQEDSTNSDREIERLSVCVNAGLLKENQRWIRSVSMNHLKQKMKC